MVEIRKKILPASFNKVASREKNGEVRLADFECKPWDMLVLEEWNPETKKYAGRKLEKVVSYIMNTKDVETYHSKKEIDKHGLLVIGLK